VTFTWHPLINRLLPPTTIHTTNMAVPQPTTSNASQLPSPQGPVDAFERRLVWKLDLIILPTLGLIYFLASMGRTDIGNALIAGMDKDLEVTPARYTTIVTVFLVGYIVFQPAGTFFLRVLTPPIQLGAAMVAWGVVTVCHVTAKSWVEIAVMRLFVGIAEAFTQGATLYLSFWYTSNELATRGAIFQSMTAIAGAFNGLLAYAIARDLGGYGGWAAWQWIFIVEGVSLATGVAHAMSWNVTGLGPDPGISSHLILSHG
jgi:MFS family permease